MNWLRDIPDGVAIHVHVVPRARRNQLAGRHGTAIKVRLQAPPVDDKANRALIAFLAESLAVSPSHLRIHSGWKSRDKQVCVRGVSRDYVADILGGGKTG